MENRLADQIKLLQMLQAKGLGAASPEVQLIAKLLNDEYDYGYRSGVYEATGVMSERNYGTGKYKR